MNADTAAYIDRIKTAYHQLIDIEGKQPGAWISLTNLRAEVRGDRERVDAALIALNRDPGVSIIPTSAQWTLTPADRAAAVRIGNQDKHEIAIR